MSTAGERIRGTSFAKIEAITREIETLEEDVRTIVSTVARDTGRKWIGDKTIWAITIDIGALPNATTKNVAHGISGATRMWIAKESYATDGTNFFPLPYPDVTAASTIEVRMNGTNVIIVTGANYSTYSGFVTLEYTLD